MDGQNSLGMGGSGSENLNLDDEVFQELSPIEFSYPESNIINLDLDANYLLDNPLGTTIHSSMDVLPDPIVVHDGGISAVQPGEFGLSDQERTILNSSPIPDQGLPGTNLSNFPTPGVNSLHVPNQEVTGMSFTSLLTQGMNSGNAPGQGIYELGSSSLPTHNINSSNLHNQELSMMDLLNLPTQVTYVNTLELHNQGSSRMDTFGIPTQESFTNTLEFPNYNLSMTNALGIPGPELTSIGFVNQEPNINTSGVPYESPPVFTTMGDNRGKAELITISTSDDEQLQEVYDSTDGNDDGDSDGNPNSILRKSISKEMISQYYHLSLMKEARALNVGSTVLKRRCRELEIKRWPQRKIKSLEAIIASLQKSGESSGSIVGENERKRIEDNPDLPLEDDTIRLRQSLYKSSHRKRKQSDRDHWKIHPIFILDGFLCLTMPT